MAMGQCESEGEEVEGEGGSMSGGLVEEGRESRGEASGTGDPICLVLC